MASFWRVSVQTALDQASMAKVLSEAMPELAWKTGDSDAQGPYITGRIPGRAEVQLWLEIGLVDAGISASLTPTADQGAWGAEFARRLIDEVLPRIGQVTSVREQ